MSTDNRREIIAREVTDLVLFIYYRTIFPRLGRNHLDWSFSFLPAFVRFAQEYTFLPSFSEGVCVCWCSVLPDDEERWGGGEGASGFKEMIGLCVMCCYVHMFPGLVTPTGTPCPLNLLPSSIAPLPGGHSTQKAALEKWTQISIEQNFCLKKKKRKKNLPFVFQIQYEMIALNYGPVKDKERHKICLMYLWDNS